MKNTIYRFITKDGHIYSAKGQNPIEAREELEWLFNIDLTGSVLQIVYKLRVVEEWTVR